LPDQPIKLDQLLVGDGNGSVLKRFDERQDFRKLWEMAYSVKLRLQALGSGNLSFQIRMTRFTYA
jgi:hypothetical protein